MSGLPKDPMILLSVVNTGLRDRYGSLDSYCEGEEADKEKIEQILEAAGFTYDPDQNRFI